ncbi:YbaK/EbsC family protein [Sellimonas sp.]|uniref:YbaK/EbsC family protein n=1 Tax=Sellimonas sp. TaxID=2021466 RepID=UPI00257FD653|nr:YbaK/EbsC family protein [Sellimonas sp.]
MSIENVKQYLKRVGMEQRIMELAQSSATVEEAASAIGCRPCQIAKTLSFLAAENPILIVTAGDAKVDNKKYKNIFHEKAKMIPADQVETYIGHAPGGVCPFAVHPGVTVYLDQSLRRFEKVYPAAGNGHSAVSLSLEELETYSCSSGWIDVCRGWCLESDTKNDNV